MQSDKLCLIKVSNPFKPKDRLYKYIEYKEETLLDIRNKHFPQDVEIIVSVNGLIIPKDKLALYKPKMFDQILCKPSITGDGNDILRAIAFIALAAFAIFGLGPLTGLTGSWLLAAQMGTMVVGGLLINMLLPPPMPEMAAAPSQAYGWNPQTTQQQGIPIPEIFGRVKVRGNLINYDIQFQDTEDKLSMLNCLGMGRIKGIIKNSVKINDQPVGNFPGLKVISKKGKITQDIIEGFEYTAEVLSVGQEVIYDEPVDNPGITQDFGPGYDEADVIINCPYGLYNIHDEDGEYYNKSVKVRVDVKESGGTYYSISKGYILEDKVTATYERWSAGRWLPASMPWFGFEWKIWQELAAGSTNEDDHDSGDVYSVSDYTDAYWRWLTVGDTYYPNLAVDYVTLSGDSPNPKKFTFHAHNLDNTKSYTVRVTKLTAEAGSNEVHGDDIYFLAIRQIRHDDFSHPRHALVGVKALASKKLSGSLNFSCIVEGKIVRVYRDAAWYIEFSNNPAWVMYHIFTQPVIKDDLSGVWRYDGYDPSNMDYLAFKEYADYCDELVPNGLAGSQLTQAAATGDTIIYVEDVTSFSTSGTGYIFDAILHHRDAFSWTGKVNNTLTGCTGVKDHLVGAWACPEANIEKRFTFNGIFDQESTMWESALRVGLVSRAVPYFNGTAITVAVDKEVNVAQLFSDGNIITDSFRCIFLPMAERAAEIECDFLNKRKDYDRDTLNVYDPDITSTAHKISLQCFGLTRPSEVWRLAKNRLAHNKYDLRAIEWKANVDAIDCTLGDVVNFQHSVLQLNKNLAEGRVVSATSNTITLDREVVIEAAKSYSIMVRLSNNNLLTKAVLNTPGTYSVLSVSSTYTRPIFEDRTNEEWEDRTDTILHPAWDKGITEAIPQKYDVYVFGETATLTKQRRIVGINLDQETLDATILTADYDARVYNSDYQPAEIPLEEPIPDFGGMPVVTGLALEEFIRKAQDGTRTNGIYVSFTPPENPNYYGARIVVKKGEYGDWKLMGTVGSDDNYFMIYNCRIGKTYKVAVCTIDKNAVVMSIELAPMATITLDGIVTDPDAPTDLTARVLFDTILLTWSNPDIMDLDSVKVYRHTSNDSAGATKIASVKGEFYADDLNAYGQTRYYWVKAKNISGGYSGFSVGISATTTGFTRIKYGEYTEGTPAALAGDAVHFEISENKWYRANPLNRNNVIGVKDSNGDIVGMGSITGTFTGGATYYLKTPPHGGTNVIYGGTGDDKHIMSSTSNHYRSQSFTTGTGDAGKSIVLVNFAMFKTGSPTYGIFIQLRADDGTGKPSNTQILAQTEEISAADLKAAFISIDVNTIEFRFFNPYEVAASTKYHLVICTNTEAEDVSNYVTVRGYSTDPYAEGDHCSGDDAEPTVWSKAANDLYVWWQYAFTQDLTGSNIVTTHPFDDSLFRQVIALLPVYRLGRATSPNLGSPTSVLDVDIQQVRPKIVFSDWVNTVSRTNTVSTAYYKYRPFPNGGISLTASERVCVLFKMKVSEAGGGTGYAKAQWGKDTGAEKTTTLESFHVTTLSETFTTGLNGRVSLGFMLKVSNLTDTVTVGKITVIAA